MNSFAGDLSMCVWFSSDGRLNLSGIKSFRIYCRKLA